MRIFSVAMSTALCASAILGIGLPPRAFAARQSEALGAADQNAVAHFRVYFPLTHLDTLERLLQSQTDVASPHYHQWLSPAQFKMQFGPSRLDVAKATRMLEGAGFKVIGEN